jgi:NAD(P)-dependent dehydrogenase (short-subunit alcohol dehydrogenase family)
MSKKNVLVFGSTGFVGKTFCKLFDGELAITRVHRSTNDITGLRFDFLSPDYNLFLSNLDSNRKFDSVIFAQGINPAMGFEEITDEHFQNMLKMNVVVPTLILQKMKQHNFLSKDASVIFLSSISKTKGSYDPSYAASKAALEGLRPSLARANREMRFLTLSLALVEGSPVQLGMTANFLEKHQKAMNGKLVSVVDVCNTICHIINNDCMNSCDIKIDRGFIS